MSATTQYLTIARAGFAIDGRPITEAMIDEAAKTYNPDLYQALINVEHIRGAAPDGQFGSFGRVLSLRTARDEAGVLVLQAQLERYPDLIKLQSEPNPQKAYWSAEFYPDFAKTKKYYLTGLAATDSPASLGTQPVALSATNKPLTLTVKSAPIHYSLGATMPTDATTTPAQTTPATDPGLIARIVAALNLSTSQAPAPVDPAPQTPADQASEVLRLSGELAAAKARNELYATCFAALTAPTPTPQTPAVDLSAQLGEMLTLLKQAAGTDRDGQFRSHTGTGTTEIQTAF